MKFFSKLTRKAKHFLAKAPGVKRFRSPPSLVTHVIKKRVDTVDTVVHVGGHHGQELDEYLSLNPRSILFIEGDPDTYIHLKKKLEGHPKSRYVSLMAVNALVSEHDDSEVEFYRFNNSGESSSIFQGANSLMEEFPGLEQTGEVLKLKTKRLDSILSDLNFDFAGTSVLVIDIQGAELLALKGLGKFIKKFKYLEVEVSTEEIYKGAPLFCELEMYIESHGFKRVTSVPWHGDVVYINSKV